MKVIQRRPTNPTSPDFVPVRMDEIEIGRLLPALPSEDPRTGTSFPSSLCLVRLHGRKPLGLVQVDLPGTGLPADALAARIQAELAEEVAQHLRDDGRPLCALDADGIPGPTPLPCVAAREEFLPDAPTVSVVICTRNRPDSVRGTLRSILGATTRRSATEVIVVDNASGVRGGR